VASIESHGGSLDLTRSGAGIPAKVCICGLAAALSIDAIVGSVVSASRGPSVYLGLLATVLALPLLPSVLRIGSRLAPVLCFAGSLLVGWGVLLILVLTREAQWNPDHMSDRPFKLLVMALLFALVASDPKWRPRMLASYMAGWGAFIAYGLFNIATGRATAVDYEGVARITVMAAGPRENEQAVVVATGMVMVLAALMRSTGVWAALYSGVLLASSLVFLSSSSRSGALALAAGSAIVMFGWVRHGEGRPLGRALRLGGVLALLAVGMAVVAARNPVAAEAMSGLQTRFAATTGGSDYGLRDVLAARTLDIALRNPLHGVGLERTNDVLGGDPHNGYLKIVAEGGVVAALLLAGGLVLTGAAVVRNARWGAGLGPAAALVVVMTSAMAGQELMHNRFWLFLAVVAVGLPPDERRALQGRAFALVRKVACS
jgi:O-antigen ligase